MAAIWASGHRLASDRLKIGLRLAATLSLVSLLGACSASAPDKALVTAAVPQPARQEGAILSLAEEQVRQERTADETVLAHAVGTSDPGVPERWHNPQTGSTGMVTVHAETRDPGGKRCRAFDALSNSASGIMAFRGDACLAAGRWAVLRLAEMP